MSIKKALDTLASMLYREPSSTNDNRRNAKLLRDAREELSNLEAESRELGFLEEYGVDNWCGYDDAIKAMRDEEVDEPE